MAYIRPSQRSPQRNARTLIWMVLIAETVFFLGLLSGYVYLRINAHEWVVPANAVLDWQIPLLNTLFLTAGCATLFGASRALRKNAMRRFDMLLFASMLTGAAFVVGQIVVFRQVGFSLADGAYPGIFLLMLGSHAAHVAVGIVIFVLVHIRAQFGLITPERTAAIDMCTLYWYLVAAVWYLFFAVLYFVR